MPFELVAFRHNVKERVFRRAVIVGQGDCRFKKLGVYDSPCAHRYNPGRPHVLRKGGQIELEPPLNRAGLATKKPGGSRSSSNSTCSDAAPETFDSIEDILDTLIHES